MGKIKWKEAIFYKKYELNDSQFGCLDWTSELNNLNDLLGKNYRGSEKSNGSWSSTHV